MLQHAYNERDRLLNSFKAKFEEEAHRLAESERNYTSLENKIRGIEKQFEIQKKQLCEKITTE